MRAWVFAGSLALALTLPLILTLSHVPQSPDGYEMVHAAVRGGVLHPSGMPFQSWLNRLAVTLSPWEAAVTLSFVSWLGAWLSTIFFILTLRLLNLSGPAIVLVAIAFVVHPVNWLLSITPEKYTWMSVFECLFLFAFVAKLRGSKSLWWATIAMILALVQHSALIVLLPAYLYLVWLERARSRPLLHVFSLITSVLAAYASLLLLRGQSFWPDWGQLSTLIDVWHHAIRSDYGIVGLHNSNSTMETISGLRALKEYFISWNLSFILVPLGLFAVYRADKKFASGLILTSLAGLTVLATAKMPVVDIHSVTAYQERYQILILPVLMVLSAFGISWLISLNKKLKWILIAPLAICMAVYAYQGYQRNLPASSNLVEVYRHEFARQIPVEAIFWTASDFVAFSGIPTDQGTWFPLKNIFGLRWYREETAPKIEPRFQEIATALGPGPWGPPQILRKALSLGFTVAATEATHFLPYQDLMAQAEQIGLVWVFSPKNQGLYSAKILSNSLQMCEALEHVTHPVPIEGLGFLKEFLESFRFGFLGAADFLESRGLTQATQSARAVASALVPGAAPTSWKPLCETYSAALRLALTESR